LIAFGVPLAISLGDRVDSEVRSEARSQADVVAATAAELLGPSDRRSLDRLTAVSARTVRGRVITVNGRGRLLADSSGPAEVGAGYADRPEVSAALRGQPLQITRHSNTLGQDLLATSVPIIHDGRPIGAVRITQSVDAVNRAVRSTLLDLALLGGVVLLLGLGAGALIAGQVARPIHRLDEAARAVAEGDLETAVRVEGSREQRSLARAFNEMTARVRRQLQAQRDFVADASHQLRTPLTGLRLRLEALRDRSRADRDGAGLEGSLREVDRLTQMVNELLLLSQAGERELPSEPVDLGRAAERAAERWRATAAEKGIEIRASAKDPAVVSCATADLDRALDPLVENAVAYSPDGGLVEVLAAGPRVEVLDRGPGPEPGEEETVFERFRRGSAGRKGASGTGLGLSIARELTRRWGGEVSLQAREGGGSRAAVAFAQGPDFAGPLPPAGYRRAI
jgi:two-component system, OmpR family, sensor kinase